MPHGMCRRLLSSKATWSNWHTCEQRERIFGTRHVEMASATSVAYVNVTSHRATNTTFWTKVSGIMTMKALLSVDDKI